MQLYQVINFYQFTLIKDPSVLQASIKELCKKNSILGTILLAEEGINGTIAGTKEHNDILIRFLKGFESFQKMNYKYSTSQFIPFKKLKVSIKKEIVTFGQPLCKNDKTGISVSPLEWNDLLKDPEVLLIDTRNDFEINLGTFNTAINPKTKKFSDFKMFVEGTLEQDNNKKRKIAMFCTGGIRCEKASSYLLERGFKDVYQLQGGILNYLEMVPQEKNLWQGECFVFDERISIAKDKEKGV